MLAEAGLKDHVQQLLIGHIGGLTQTYVRISQKELLSQYSKALDLDHKC